MRSLTACLASGFPSRTGMVTLTLTFNDHLQPARPRGKAEGFRAGSMATVDVTMPLLPLDDRLLDHLRPAARSWLAATDRGQQGTWDLVFRGQQETKNNPWAKKQSRYQDKDVEFQGHLRYH